VTQFCFHEYAENRGNKSLFNEIVFYIKYSSIIVMSH